MRKIIYIVLHCTATQPETSISSIENYWHNVLGWKSPGYHFIIDKNGNSCQLTPLDKIANGVKGYNQNSIHVAYIGGVAKNGKPKDTRTKAQKKTILKLLKELRVKFPKATIQGHRDFPNIKKDCPCFNAKEEYCDI